MPWLNSLQATEGDNTQLIDLQTQKPIMNEQWLKTGPLKMADLALFPFGSLTLDRRPRASQLPKLF